MALLAMAPLAAQTGGARLRPLPGASANVKTGPEVGQRVPAFRLADQTGTPRDLRSLSGKNGLLLVFVRSADW